MSARARALAATAFVCLHLLFLAPLTGRDSPLVQNVFRPDAEAVLDGVKPYSERDFEYPPFALPLLLGPAAVSDSAEGFGQALAWEMILADLAIVVLLALAVGGRRGPVPALAAYTAGILLLTGLGPLPDSAIEDAPLPLARFDLVVGALLLGAVVARIGARSATWGALVGLGTAVKAVPAALIPVLARGEPRRERVAIGVLVPLIGAAALVLALGDEFGSAISYHSGRDLQVESLGATPFLVAHALGAGVAADFASGSWNVEAGGADAVRLLSLVLLGLGFVAVVVRLWGRPEIGFLDGAAMAVAVVVVLAPLLSPQFLLWLLPLSAAAYGLRPANLVLLAALALTALVLNYYGGVADLADKFVLAIIARNVLLLAYLAIVLAPLAAPAPARPQSA